MPASSSYPASFTFDPPERVANWRPLVNWILAIPHFVILYGLRVLAQVVAVIAWFVILFTGAMPESFANLQVMFLRYETRIYIYASFMREEYPPFAFTTTPLDEGEDPRVRVDFQPELTDRNRLTVGFRLILAIPQFVVLALLGIVAWVVLVVAFFVVLFTGRWSEAARNLVINIMRWFLRVEAYILLLADEYPPFSLEA
jgi:hypothetical protein